MGGARLADRGERGRPRDRAGVARGDAPRDPGCLADGHRARPHRAVGLLVCRRGGRASARPAGAGRPAARSINDDYLRRPRRGSATSSGSPTTSGRGPAGRRSRSPSRSAWARGPPTSRRPVPGRRGRRGSSRRTRRAAPGTCSSSSTRAAMRSTRPRSGRARHSWISRTASAAYLEGTADVLGWDVDEPAWQRRWLGEAARAARGAPRPVRRGHARRLLGALRDRAPPPPGAPPERRLDRGHRRGPRGRAAPRVVVVGDPRPADRRPGLPRQLRAVGDHGGRGPGPDRRGPRTVVRGRPGLVRFVADAPVRAGRVAPAGRPPRGVPRRATHRGTAARRPAPRR